ncbi:transglutaminase TgpA family protein [Paenibacillus caui]|uniref:transglutaminase TgpA family protein n=1 Tax=Paenibacillus caui TaxID=2873927 RepID=UPI001CA7BE98|nr:transglutaminaseTgpA domain-containing protein [Paenibacillus caui]
MKTLRKMSRSWYYLATVIWLFIIAYQWYRFTLPMWYDETSVLVLYTLVATACAEFFPVGIALRWIVKFAAIIFIHARILMIYKVYVPEGSGFQGGLAQFTEHLSPYIWFTMAAWAIFELSVRLIDRRSRVLIFVGLNLVAFTILDSFTPYFLWTETAWVVFAGMGWLVTNHFRRMELNHPKGWKALRKSPLRIFGNIVVIFACVLWIGVSMPTVNPVLKDPYSLLKNNWSSEGIVSGSSATGSGTSGNAASASSGYSRDDSNLGGGFNFDNSPVMNVTSNARAYWRGETRQYYTGTGWVDNTRESLGLRGTASGESVSNPQQGTVPTEQVVQRVTMLTNRSYPVLFGAYSISKIDIPEEADLPGLNPRLVWNGQGAEMYWAGFSNSQQGNNRYPRQYTVVSEVSVIPTDRLERATFSDLYGDRPDEESYLQIPSAFPDRVKELAEQITASSTTPYGKVSLLKNYLTENYTYTNTPDLSRKKSSDFVDSFLFEIKEGYCDYFSTSLVMMARSLDIPARWVKGYAPGQLNSVDAVERMNPGIPQSSEQTYMVTNADAHSWAEVYFGEEYGWVPIEATPGFTLPTHASAQEQQAEPVATEEPEPEEQDPVVQPDNMAKGSNLNAALIGWIAGSIIAVWAAFTVWRYRNGLYFWLLRIKHGRSLTAADKVVAEARRWQVQMKRQGYGRAPHETLREAVLRWERDQPEVSESLHLLLEQFEQAKYSTGSVDEDDWIKTRHLSKRLRQSLRRSRSKKAE